MNRLRFATTPRLPRFAALAALILALAGLAHADAISAEHWHKAKKGSLKITAPAEVGGVTLQPGEYEVKEVSSAAGPVVEFTRLLENDYLPEGLPVYDREVVARVMCTLLPLTSTPRHTHLLLASNTSQVIGLEIRGKRVDYRF